MRNLPARTIYQPGTDGSGLQNFCLTVCPSPPQCLVEVSTKRLNRSQPGNLNSCSLATQNIIGQSPSFRISLGKSEQRLQLLYQSSRARPHVSKIEACCVAVMRTENTALISNGNNRYQWYASAGCPWPQYDITARLRHRTRAQALAGEVSQGNSTRAMKRYWFWILQT